MISWTCLRLYHLIWLITASAYVQGLFRRDKSFLKLAKLLLKSLFGCIYFLLFDILYGLFIYLFLGFQYRRDIFKALLWSTVSWLFTYLIGRCLLNISAWGCFWAWRIRLNRLWNVLRGVIKVCWLGCILNFIQSLGCRLKIWKGRSDIC